LKPMGSRSNFCIIPRSMAPSSHDAGTTWWLLSFRIHCVQGNRSRCDSNIEAKYSPKPAAVFCTWEQKEPGTQIVDLPCPISIWNSITQLDGRCLPPGNVIQFRRVLLAWLKLVSK